MTLQFKIFLRVSWKAYMEKKKANKEKTTKPQRKKKKRRREKNPKLEEELHENL